MTRTSDVAALTGEQYLESLQDGREVWIDGERVADVTAHPAFRNAAAPRGDGAESRPTARDPWHRVCDAGRRISRDRQSMAQQAPFAQPVVDASCPA